MKPTRAIYGFHAVLARLRVQPSSVDEILLDEARSDVRAKDVAIAAERANVRLLRVPAKRLDGFHGGGRHQGVVALVHDSQARESLDELLEKLTGPALLLV